MSSKAQSAAEEDAALCCLRRVRKKIKRVCQTLLLLACVIDGAGWGDLTLMEDEGMASNGGPLVSIYFRT